MDRSSGNGRRLDSPAIPLDVRHIAIVLETQRHTLPAEARHARLDCAAEYLRLSACAPADLSGHRSDVLRFFAAVGFSTIPRNKIAATLDHSGRRKIRDLLP